MMGGILATILDSLALLVLLDGVVRLPMLFYGLQSLSYSLIDLLDVLVVYLKMSLQYVLKRKFKQLLIKYDSLQIVIQYRS